VLRQRFRYDGLRIMPVIDPETGLTTGAEKEGQVEVFFGEGERHRSDRIEKSRLSAHFSPTYPHNHQKTNPTLDSHVRVTVTSSRQARVRRRPWP